MRLSKSQSAVIALLNIVIVALVAVLLFVPGISVLENKTVNSEPASVEPESPPTDTEPIHNKLRAPSEGKANGIISETQLMGLGDETVVRAFFLFDGIFIFGNATVKGLDFDSYGGFVCKLSNDGAIEAFSYFDGKINAAIAFGKKFIAVAGKKVYAVDTDCDITVCVSETDGDALDIVHVDNVRVAAVTQPSATSLKLTEYTATDDGLTVGRSTRIYSSYTLSYLSCTMFNDTYVLSARAHSLPRYDSLVMYSFVAGGGEQTHLYGGSDENITHPYAVMPCFDGYLVAASKNGIATLININYSFTVFRSQSLEFTSTGARLFFSGGSYYACFDCAYGPVTYKVDGTNERTQANYLDGIKLGVAKDGLIMGTGNKSSSVDKADSLYVVQEDKSLFSFAVSGGEVYAFDRVGDKITAVISADGGDALSSSSGGRDVYILILDCK